MRPGGVSGRAGFRTKACERGPYPGRFVHARPWGAGSARVRLRVEIVIFRVCFDSQRREMLIRRENDSLGKKVCNFSHRDAKIMTLEAFQIRNHSIRIEGEVIDKLA